MVLFVFNHLDAKLPRDCNNPSCESNLARSVVATSIEDLSVSTPKEDRYLLSLTPDPASFLAAVWL